MTDPSQFDVNNNESNGENARQLLELELQKIRSEASAARLDARAAEIEIVMQRLRVDDPSTGDDARSKAADETLASKPRHRFASWSDLRTAQIASGAPMEGNAKRFPDSVPNPGPVLRFDAPHSAPPSRHLFSDDADSIAPCNAESEGGIDLVEENSNDDVACDVAKPVSLFTTDCVPLPTLDHESIEFAGQLSEAWEDDEEPEPQKRGKSAAVLVSALVHVAVLLVLAAIGLQIHDPKDQVALSASVSSSEEAAMESFSIESIDQPEPETEVTEPTPAETEYEVSPIGDFKAADFSMDAIASPVSSMATAMTSQSDPNLTAKMLKSDSVSKMKFCGVEGGGNHFVYLVDSSGSMGDAFESARRELLASIDLLSPDQRFYVVFFDAKSDFMRITNAGVDEPRSVYATAKNKAALRRWAMRISMDRGKAPYDPLKFALGLRADVIFLLSDGEFPEGIPTLLKEENRVENLFGETKPISIVHTISYFSKEGASIMTRIAKQNHGQYRHVPKP